MRSQCVVKLIPFNNHHHHHHEFPTFSGSCAKSKHSTVVGSRFNSSLKTRR